MISNLISGIAARQQTDTPRTRWADVKAAARASGDAERIEAVRAAEEHAREAMIAAHGRAAAVFPTDAQINELCAGALCEIALYS